MSIVFIQSFLGDKPEVPIGILEYLCNNLLGKIIGNNRRLKIYTDGVTEGFRTYANANPAQYYAE